MKKSTKLLALCCALLMMVVTVAGCASTPAAPSATPEATASAQATPEQSDAAAEATPADAASATPTLDAIRERGTLILGTESTYPPFEFIVVENGQSVGVGMDVALAQVIADKLGVKLVQSEMAFDSITPAIQTGTIDIGASFTPTEERKQVLDFSENYYNTTNCFVVRVAEKDQFTSKESFDGKKIGAQLGTAQNDLLLTEMTNAQNLILPKCSTLIQELKTGNIDAICLEKPVADTYVAANPDALAVCSFEVPVAEGGVAIPVAKGKEDLVAFINDVIAEMIANGEMQRIYDEAVALAIDQIGAE